jgi:hypothetical protein
MKIGRFSSKIVQSILGGSLTVLIAATPCPTFGAPTVRTMGSLSAAERANLPDSTLIELKPGETVSLGTLRLQHNLRLQRFANAAKLGMQQASLHQKVGTPVSNTGSTRVPMNFALSTFAPFPGPFAADFSAFCGAANVTTCLYLPGGVPLIPVTGAVLDADPLITDQQVCASEGGQLTSIIGCVFAYPTASMQQFNPGLPTAQGYNVTQSAWCPSPFAYSVDPHGAVTASYGASGPTTLPWLEFCLVSVFVQN